MNEYPTRRMRRLRYNATLRDMLVEIHLRPEQFIAPLFIRLGKNVRREMTSLPGQFQLSPDQAVETARRWADLGLRSVLLFGIPERKDAAGSSAWDEAGPVPQAVAAIKRALPEMLVITDVCLCEYTDHGHCGPVAVRPDGRQDVDNDAALPGLARAAVAHARAGADMVAPSDMMDGRVGAIRAALDQADLSHTLIMSYAVKFASSFYGPFREAAESEPRFGDRRSYQMDWRAPRQVEPEIALDLAEGADIVMVKPAATYLDVIARVRDLSQAPVAAYHVSGEYSMLKAAAERGWLDEQAAVLEITSAIRRAGADLIITYYAESLARWLS